MIFKKFKIKILFYVIVFLLNFSIFSKQTMTISIFGNAQSLSSLLASDNFLNDISKQMIDIFNGTQVDENNGLYNVQKVEKYEFKELPSIL